jgi:hypothetical protein
MTAGAVPSVQPCADNGHEWELREDYEGDGSVPGGMRRLVWLECVNCPATKVPEPGDLP